MVQIQQIPIWNNGQIKQAIYLNLACVYDNLKDTATFYYTLLSEDLIILADGNLQMNDPEYSQYSSSTDSNLFAYEWAAHQLNLTIINYNGERASIKDIKI